MLNLMKTGAIVLTFSISVLVLYFIELSIVKEQINKSKQQTKHAYAERSQRVEKYLGEFETDIENLLNEYRQCDSEFLAKLKSLKLRRAVLTEVYLLDGEENICGSVTGDLIKFSYDKTSSAIQYSASEEVVAILKSIPNKNITLAWLISYREIWNTVNLLKNEYVTIEFTLNDEFLLGIERNQYYTIPKIKTVSKVFHNDHEGHHESPLKIHFYYAAPEDAKLSTFSWLIILIIAVLLTTVIYVVIQYFDDDLKFQIKLGLKRNEFTAHFQPIVDIRSGEWVGAESLIRWFRSGKIYKTPDEFIPISEKLGISKEFSRICAFESRTLLENTLDNMPFINVNISPNDFDIFFIEEILDKHEKRNLKSKIGIEITERGFKDGKFDEIRSYVSMLHNVGIHISLDDFGTGQAGLSYINKLCFHKIKIDKQFIDAIGTDSVNAHILNTIIYLAKQINAEMVAEGVEKQEQVDWLIMNGVYYAQGWFFERDLPKDTFIKKLNNNADKRAI